MKSFELLIATKNAGKIREIEKLLADLPITLRNTGEFTDLIEPEETGATFAENATLKAKYYAEKTGIWSLADDSGLEVEALEWRPGVFSARYGGADATNEEKIAKLLNELEQTDSNSRLARFVCSMVIADKSGEIQFLTEGVCQGEIAFIPQGSNGFGYDPVFVPKGFSQTFGQLSGEIKHKISHRSRAIEKIIKYLADLIAP
ncbi:MAG: RdgB/HAM1 family non-canonical purine NTP pyrophosphatase [Blastocatellia bacterium]|nr:RdgB/HAM1 family non-canonical purine NTP pyrophosphatase [Blastocatellia bacterium]